MPPKKKEVDFSKDFSELEEIAAWFERGEPDLEEGIKRFERATEIAHALKERLDKVENKIKEIRERGV